MQLFFAVGETGASYLVLHSQRRAFSDRDRAVLDLLAHTSRSSGSDTAASPTLQLRLRPRLRFSALASRNPRPFASGMTNREIAAVLFIAPGTVREHLDNVYAKLGVRSRAQAVAVTVVRGQSALIAESQALEYLSD